MLHSKSVLDRGGFLNREDIQVVRGKFEFGLFLIGGHEEWVFKGVKVFERRI